MNQPYKVKWYIEPYNFGDVLTPHILRYFNIPFEYVDDIHDANLLCVGSVARLSVDNMTVLGSGVIRQNEKANPNSIWKCVRGPFTRENVIKFGGQCPEVYGDPALLLPLFCPESKKEYEIGIVPHYNDFAHVTKTYPNYKIIDVVNTNPLDVAVEITKCRKIISSSLHGIICAHAYNIPAAWVQWSKLHGDGIKFADHYASVGTTGTVSTLHQPKYTTGNNIQLELLIETFSSIGTIKDLTHE